MSVLCLFGYRNSRSVPLFRGNLHFLIAIWDTRGMKKFKTIDDVEAWLGPMNYEEFWRAIRPYCLVIHRRSDCDEQIAAGLVDKATVLDGLKYLARIELTKRHGLHWKVATPWLRVVNDDD